MDIASSPRFFRRGPKPLTRLLVCCALSLALLVADAKLALLEPARGALSVLLYPMQWLVTAPPEGLRQLDDLVTTQTTLAHENQVLRTYQLELEARLQRQAALLRENAELRQTLSLRGQHPGSTLAAEIVYTSRDPFTYTLIIDKGSRDGVQAGLPVIDARGLVGQITRVQPLTAEVTLLIERNHPVPVMVQRNGLRAVLYGMGGQTEVRHVAAHADIRVGDLLVTSGIDGVYPAGLPVARVGLVDRNSGSPFARIDCTPLAGVAENRTLLVLNETLNLPPRPEPAPAPKQKSRRKHASDE
jgi:rod shape-determining protein MreC